LFTAIWICQVLKISAVSIGGASKSNALETGYLGLLFNATAIADIAENDTSSPLTTLYVSLHTADPTEGGTQNSSEISYTGYARVGLARTSGGWTVSGASVSPAAAIPFGEMTAGAGGTVTHFAVGSLSSGAGVLYYIGTVDPNLSVVNGVIPQLKATTAITED
jgi:hypothetical protein